jgi:hypothetical protein
MSEHSENQGLDEIESVKSVAKSDEDDLVVMSGWLKWARYVMTLRNICAQYI